MWKSCCMLFRLLCRQVLLQNIIAVSPRSRRASSSAGAGRLGPEPLAAIEVKMMLADRSEIDSNQLQASIRAFREDCLNDALLRHQPTQTFEGHVVLSLCVDELPALSRILKYFSTVRIPREEPTGWPSG